MKTKNIQEMQEKTAKQLLTKNVTVAILLGLALPITILIIDFFIQDIPRDFKGFLHLYKINPLHYVLLSSPVVLGIIAYYVTKPLQKNIENKEQKIEQELAKTKKIRTYTEKLINDEASEELDKDIIHDNLGKSLINLRKSLLENKKIEAQRRKEDEQRNWIAEGLARFSEILRQDNSDIEVLSYNIISNLVNYTNANQGGFFILNDQDEHEKYFELTGAYAYERKKFTDKRVEWGEGLIGSAGLEKQTIYLKEIPDSYLEITSGLGKSNPRSLLIVPLIINDELHGILEIASFEEFPPYKIDFIEKLAESIASTISSVKINVRTSKLLDESREQAEVLASQEEEMRQNMEELQATQEEAARQAEKFISFTNSVNHTLIRAEYDVDGTLLYANTKFLNKLGYTSNSEVEGQHISMFINNKDKDWFFKIWDKLSRGGKHFEGDMKHMTKQGQDLWTMATYTCVRKEDGGVEKILFLAIDTTEQKKQSLDYEGQIRALNRSATKVDFDTVGNIVDHNAQFIDALKYTAVDLRDKTVSDLIEDRSGGFKTNWDNITKGIPFQGQYMLKTKFGEEKWFRAYFTPVYNMYGEVNKIVMISYETTKERLMEIETKMQNEQLKEQEEKLRESDQELRRKLKKARAEMEEQFREIEKVKVRNEKTLEGSLDAIVTINQDAKIEFFNKAAEELWGKKRSSVLRKDVKVLFSQDTIESDDFIARFVDPSKEKIIGTRQEVMINTASEDSVPVLFLISEARVEGDHSYTAFIQNIEVELF